MLTMLVLVTTAEAKKPKGPPPAPPVGWHHEEGWKGDCYYPPDFGAMPEGDRKMARANSLEEMKKQWLGQRDDGVTFDETLEDEVETVLLGHPTAIEDVAATNRDDCVAYMKGGNTESWRSHLSALPGKLTAGECLRPLTYTVFDYLDIGNGWQRPITLCKGDKAHIVATVKDRYRVSDNGPWINVEGDPSQKATDSSYPCSIDGCTVGMLVAKFTTDAGVETIFPIGAEKTYVAPENGVITYSINDTAWYDNKWFKSSTIEDRTAITIEPG
jgi:hypothetical protein